MRRLPPVEGKPHIRFERWRDGQVAFVEKGWNTPELWFHIALRWLDERRDRLTTKTQA